MNSTNPRWRAVTASRARSSVSSARRLGTGRLRASSSKVEVENPKAPAAIESSSTLTIAASSDAVAARSHAASPITYMRRIECPISTAVCRLTRMSSMTSRYCSNVSHVQGMPSAKARGGMSSM